MIIQRSKKFRKQYKKLPVKVQRQFDDRLRLFVLDQTHPLLRVHPLGGELEGLWSINVNGDVRAIYEVVDGKIYLYQMIGTHSQLYG